MCNPTHLLQDGNTKVKFILKILEKFMQDPNPKLSEKLYPDPNPDTKRII